MATEGTEYCSCFTSAWKNNETKNNRPLLSRTACAMHEHGVRLNRQHLNLKQSSAVELGNIPALDLGKPRPVRLGISGLDRPMDLHLYNSFI